MSVKANPDQDTANQPLKQLGKSSCYIGGYFSVSEHPRALQGPNNHRMKQSLGREGISFPVAQPQHTQDTAQGTRSCCGFSLRLKPSHSFPANIPWGSPVTNWKLIKQPWINKGKGQLPGTPALCHSSLVQIPVKLKKTKPCVSHEPTLISVYTSGPCDFWSQVHTQTGKGQSCASGVTEISLNSPCS